MFKNALSKLALLLAGCIGATTANALTSDAWNWVDVAEALCANGTATGYGINPHAGATNLLIYLQGGGECTSQDSCWGTTPTAANLNGYNASSFASDSAVGAPIFQRVAQNPFADATIAYVPYCTGDLHIGTKLSNLPTPTYFYGGANLARYLSQLAAQFPGVQHVWISGSSAGGYGAMLNQAFVAEAFPGLPVDVIDDSGPPVSSTVVGTSTQWGPRVPDGCTNCTADISNYYAYDRAKFPQSRFAMLTFAADTVLPGYYQLSLFKFATQLARVLGSMKSDPKVKVFEVLTASHVVLGDSSSQVQLKLLSWLTLMVQGSSSWNNKTVLP